MPPGVHQHDVIPLRDGGGVFLEIKARPALLPNSVTRGVELLGQLTPVTGMDNGVQEVIFAEGTHWSADDLRRLAMAQPLEHDQYDRKVEADEAARRTTRIRLANDPARFKHFVADLRAGMRMIGIDPASQSAFLPATVLDATGESCDPASTPPRWHALAELRRWQLGLVNLAAALKKRYVVEDALSYAMCDLGPCPPPSRAEVIADTVASLSSRVLPHLRLNVLTAAAGKGAFDPSQFRGPLRIASSGDSKMDDAIRSVIARLGPNSGLSLDARSFPVPLAEANVLIASLGRWDSLPAFSGRDYVQAVARWEQERQAHFPWRVVSVTPTANPLFAFVAGKAGGDARAIGARLLSGRFDDTPLIAAGSHGDVVAGACAPGRNPTAVEDCLRAISLHPSHSGDNRRWRSETGCQSDYTKSRSVLARLAAAVAAVFRWFTSIFS